MNKQEAIERIAKIFEEDFEIPAEKLQPGVNIFMDLGLDSLDMVELMFGLQKAFKIQIQDGDEVRAIRTLDDLYNFVLKTIDKSASCNPAE